MAEALLNTERRLQAGLDEVPMVAILRGLPTADAVAVVGALLEAGIRVAEVPLNSPTPFETIRLLVQHFGERMLIGAGTVTQVAQVEQLAQCGGVLCVSPNTDAEVIATAQGLGLVAMPGYQTPSEAFAALAAGARYLKFFPAAGRVQDLAALKAVLPTRARVVAVGGITPGNLAEFRTAGAGAVGIGSELYRAGARAEAVREKAITWVAACRAGGRGATVSLLCQPMASIGEAPLWRPAERAVLWVDPVQGTLLRYELDKGCAQVRPLEASVSSLASLPDGRLAGALPDGFCHLDETTGRTVRGPRAELDAGCRFNDMTVDSTGGLWAGALHKGALATRGALYHAPSVEAPVRSIATGLGVPNGMALDERGGVLYVIDTLARQLLAYPLEIAAGRVDEPRLVTDFMGVPGKPDGMALAPDGSLWVAMWGGACVVQIAPQTGATLQRVVLPAPQVSSVCTDGAGRLFVTTSRMRLSERELAAAPGSGALFSVTAELGL
jgi:Entner-Doudoroff aldolase